MLTERYSWEQVVDDVVLHAHGNNVPQLALECPGVAVTTCFPCPDDVASRTDSARCTQAKNVLWQPPQQCRFNGVAGPGHAKQDGEKKKYSRSRCLASSGFARFVPAPPDRLLCSLSRAADAECFCTGNASRCELWCRSPHRVPGRWCAYGAPCALPA